MENLIETLNSQATEESVLNVISLIDWDQDVTPDFLESAVADEVTTLQAVNDWFKGEPVAVFVSTVGDQYVDFKFIGHDTVSRACVSPVIKKGDLFNVYYSESSKTGVEWNGDLFDAIKNTDFEINGYKIRFNPAYNEFQVNNINSSGSGEFAGSEFALLKDAGKG